MLLERLADLLDGRVHFWASLIGIALSLYVMQLWSAGQIGKDIFCVAQMRRASLVLLALSLIAGLSYADRMKWSPWPTDTLMVIAVDLFLFSTAISAHIRRRENSSPSSAAKV